MGDWLTLVTSTLRAQLDAPDVFTRLGYTPTERQAEFHAATEHDVLFGGAAGGGKSRALLMQGIAWCHSNPGVRIGAFRRSYVELKDSLFVELAKVGYAAALGASWHATDYELRFPNGSILLFRYAENIADATKRQGGEYQGLLIDELTLMNPDVVEFIRSRLRSGDSGKPVLGIRSSSNPGGTGHGSVKAQYIDATKYGTVIARDAANDTVRFIPSKVADNPHVDKAYANRLNRLPEAMRKAFRDGSWDVFAGQFFTEWDRSRHIVKPFDLPVEWRRYAGIDWGYAAPWAVLWVAVDEDGRAWIYDELYATQVGESEQAKRILAAEEGHGTWAGTRLADDAMWTTRGEAKSVARVYADNGCSIRKARKGERVSGWQRVRTFLADGPACQHHRAAGLETCPMLHVLDGKAPNLVRTLPTLPFDTLKVEDVDTKAEDHAADALRYVLINLHKPAAERWLTPEPEDDPTIYEPGPFPQLIDIVSDDTTWQEATGLWD